MDWQSPSQNSVDHSAVSGPPVCFERTALPPLKPSTKSSNESVSQGWPLRARTSFQPTLSWKNPCKTGIIPKWNLLFVINVNGILICLFVNRHLLWAYVKRVTAMRS